MIKKNREMRSVASLVNLGKKKLLTQVLTTQRLSKHLFE